MYSTGCNTISKARRFCQKLYNDGMMIQNPLMRFDVYVKDFFSATSRYCEWKAVNGKPMKPATIAKYNNHIKYQLIPFLGEYRLDKITTETAKKWVIWASKQWGSKTINNAQGVLNIILEDAIDKGYLVKNPLRKIGFRRVNKKNRDLLSPTEIAAIYLLEQEWIHPECRQAFLLAAITGMRIGEVIALRNEDIRNGYLDVTHSFSKLGGLQSTKTGQNRYVPIPAGLTFSSNSKTEYVFALKSGKLITNGMLYKDLMRICKKLGIDRKGRGITIHSLRNSFISYLQSQNITESKIRAVVGHTDETMTDLYTYWKPNMFPEVYEAQKTLYEIITGGRKCEQTE